MTQTDKGRERPLGAPGMIDGQDVANGSNCGEPSGELNERDAPSQLALPRRKQLPHEIPSWVQDGAIYFVTICCAQRGRNQLCTGPVAEHLFEAVQFRHDRFKWYVHLLVLMPDHLHLLVSFPTDEAMKKVISNFKEMTAKAAGVVWQQNFFDHRLRSGESFDEKAHYLRMNPVRKGLVIQPEDWPYFWTASNAARPAVAPYLP